MKKLTLLISYFLALLFAIQTSAQPGWNWQNPLPQGNPLYSINFLKDYGWAVGPKGTAIHTTDGGLTWKLIDLGIDDDINSIYMHDDLMAFMVGNNGLIKLVIERENGFEITHYPKSTSANLRSVTSFVSDTEGGCPWAVGNDGAIFRSNDFWYSWEDQSIPYFSHFYSIDNVSCSEAWATGPDGIVLYTSDEGNSWNFRNVPTNLHLLSISAANSNNIRVAGQQSNIWQSTDKGLTWMKEYEEPGYNLNDIKNIDANVAYAVGDQGKIFETLDNGNLWELKNSGTTATLYDVEDQWASNQVWVSGHYGILLKNSGAGTNFEVITKGLLGFLQEVEFVNKTTGWAVGGGTADLSGNSTGVILHTSDGGENWDVQLNLSSQLSSVDFINESEGWAVGRDGTIRHTINGGQSWTTQSCPIGGYLTAIDFIDENNGWVVSRDNWGQIIHTSNGGTSWTEQVNPSSNPLHGLFFINQNKGWAVGLDSTILRTIDGGQNWERAVLQLPNNYGFTDVYFTNEMHGCAVGVQGCILLTVDGGISWQKINTGFYESLNSVYFIDERNGWASGDQGTILRTVNGGKTWFKQRSGVSTNYLSSVYFIDHKNGWVVGEGGTIIQTKNGGFSHEHGTFWVQDLGLPILDKQETKSSIEVNVDELTRNEYLLTGIELMIDTIIHTRVSDLEIYLEHEGISSTAVFHVTDEGENFLWTKLIDDTPNPITDGVSPFSGNYKPFQPLEVFNALNPNGTWTLTVFDSEIGHEGTLNGWGIKPIFEKMLSIDEYNNKNNSQNIQLYQNMPNPFSAKTSISWSSEVSGATILKVFSINGMEVVTLIDKYLPEGEYNVEFDASKLSPGMYYYRLIIGNNMLTKKCIIY